MTTLPLPPVARPVAAAAAPVFADEAGPSTLLLRDAREADVPALLALEAQFPGDRMTAALFRALVASRRARVRVAELAGRIVGYHVVRRRWFSRLGWLYSLAVDAPARRRGLGRRLLADAIHLARTDGRTGLVLEVRQDNAAAIALYERAGFRRVKALRHYYDDRGDGWRYRRDGRRP